MIGKLLASIPSNYGPGILLPVFLRLDLTSMVFGLYIAAAALLAATLVIWGPCRFLARRFRKRLD